MPFPMLDMGLPGPGNIPGVPGAVGINSPFYSNAPIVEGANVQSLSAAGSQTLTTAHMINQILLRSGGTTPTDTTPTAAALVAALPGVKANSGIYWVYRNGNSGTATIAAGTGVTLATGNTNTVVTVNARTFFIQFVNVTPGSEAVTIYSLGAAAY